MSGTPMPFVAPQWFTNAGAPAVGYHLHTFLAGTTTDTPTYQDQALGSANTNPVVLDGSARASVFLVPGVSYKFELSLSTDTHPPASPLWSVDGVAAVPPGSSSADADVSGTAGEGIASGDCCYLSDGSGGTTSGRWYRTDADAVASSTGAQAIGYATSALSTGGSGTFRVSGRVTGLSGLVGGTWVYASATAGAVTSSAPANARIVGQADSTTSLIVVQSIPTASATVSGLITTGAQTIPGAKDFTGQMTLSSTSPALMDAAPTYKPGTAATRIPVSGRIFVDFAQRSNVGTSDLTSHSLEANTLATNGQAIRVTTWGRFAANANAKTVHLAFGATTVATSTSSTSWNDYQWRLEALIMRKDATNQRAIGLVALAANGSTSGNVMSQESKPAATLSGAVIVKTVGTSGTNADILQEGFIVEMLG